MKTLIRSYQFLPATKQIVLPTLSAVSIESLLLVTNVATNTIIYNFADPAKGATAAGNVVTLDFNTTSMSGTDALQIYYDDPVVNSATAEAQTAMAAQLETNTQVVNLLTRIAKYCDALQVVDPQGRVKVTLDSVTAGVRNASATGSLTVGNPGANAIPIIIYDSMNQAPIGPAAFPNQVPSTASFIWAVPDVLKNMDAARLNFDQCIRSKLSF